MSRRIPAVIFSNAGVHDKHFAVVLHRTAKWGSSLEALFDCLHCSVF